MPTPRTRHFLTALGALLALFALQGKFIAAQDAPGEADSPAVVVIPMEGLIDKGLYDSLVRRVEESKAYDPALLVFHIDTYGGLVDAAIEITDEIGGLDEPKTVAFVPTKAYSAGAMIAMGAREIVLTPNASIGDAAPVTQSPEGPQIVGEKAQSPVRSIFRKYAQRNGYPEALVESMVTPELEVIEVTWKDGTVEYMLAGEFEDLAEAEKADVEKSRTVVREGEILTLTASEAEEYGIARFVVADIDEMLEKYSLTGARLVTLEVNWSEAMVRWLNDPRIASVILLLGILGVYMEFKVPGFGLPGIVGIICFATFFGSKHLSGMAAYWEILLFVVGLVLLGVEIFVIPGFGVAGFLGITFIILGLVLALIPANITLAPLDVDFLARAGAYFIATLVAAFIIGAVLAKWLPRTPVVGKFYLGEPEPQAVAHAEGAILTSGKKGLIGKIGRAETPLRPAGRAKIGGEYYDVTTQGDMVARGEEIEVIKVRGNNIIVKSIS